MSETIINTENTDNTNFITKVVGNLQDLGRSWASLGLNAGKTALETGAGNLKSAADYLGNLALKIESGAEDKAATAGEAGDKASDVPAAN